jgi:hypothetical protein
LCVCVCVCCVVRCAARYAFANLRQTCLSLPLQPLMHVAATTDCETTTTPPPPSPSGGQNRPPPAPPPPAGAGGDTSRCTDVEMQAHASSVVYS